MKIKKKGDRNTEITIVMKVAPSSVFKRIQNNILTEVTLDIISAALGCATKVPTLKGTETIQVPPGVQTGDTHVFHGKGVLDPLTRKFGNQIVTFKVATPR